MMLLSLLLWALVSAPNGGADVDKGWQVKQNSRPKLNVMMTCLGGCPVDRLAFQESRGFVCSASYETCMLPEIPTCADGETLVFPSTYRSEPNASFQMLAHETMCATTMDGHDSDLYAGERCWSPVCNSDNVQCDSGKFNSLASIGWKFDLFFMVSTFHDHDQCNSGNLNSANLFQCNAGKINNTSSFQYYTMLAISTGCTVFMQTIFQ